MINKPADKAIKGYSAIDKATLQRLDREFSSRLAASVKSLDRKENGRIIGLTGPTCSGKTTAAGLLIDHLTEHSKAVKTVSLDDFFKDVFSREELKDIDPTTLDFDSPDTLDTELLERFTEKIFKEGHAEKPIFDFVSGKRLPGGEIVCDEDDVLLFEGIQVLYPAVYDILKKYNGSVMCVRPESDILVGDKLFEHDFIRLCRRLVRDYHFRSADPSFTLSLWESVRRNEEENIFPHLDRCDLRIDTTLGYELNVLAPYLRELLQTVQPSDRNYAYSREILSRFEGIEGIDPACLPLDSLYHEFV